MATVPYTRRPSLLTYGLRRMVATRTPGIVPPRASPEAADCVCPHGHQISLGSAMGEASRAQVAEGIALNDVGRLARVQESFLTRELRTQQVVFPFVVGIGATIANPTVLGSSYAVPVLAVLGWASKARRMPNAGIYTSGTKVASTPLTLTGTPSSGVATDAPFILSTMNRSDVITSAAASLGFAWTNEFRGATTRAFQQRFAAGGSANPLTCSVLIIPHAQIEGGQFTPNFAHLEAGTLLTTVGVDAFGTGTPATAVPLYGGDSSIVMSVGADGAATGLGLEMESLSAADMRLNAFWAVIDSALVADGGIDKAIHKYEAEVGPSNVQPVAQRPHITVGH